MPAKIPAHLILDPLAPIPPKMSARDRVKLAELREAYAFAMQERIQGQKIGAPEEVANLFMPILGPLAVESLAACGLNARLQPMGPPTIITRGDVDGTEAGPRAILRAVLVQEGTQFVIAHNHPSGDPEPSPGDIEVTRRLVAAGKAIDCPLMDHVILGRGGRWVSLRRDRPDLWRAY
jgi:DNA repair protein RadC